ncbi:hypothetical protein EOA60_14090 [Mesorhizobium sp. M1A.F.Ca.IN.020.06.1.1]|uniref:hypothetical protein n=1 Tax=unclassified Mesorhizobium TaxID=325217 RepID=UPI000FCC11F4|nr:MULTISPECIES: hypothetical protein [unclassified Mesorhizobium]RUV86914.1 hypothetical protein EOA51_13040 [Mesorhizobium sp. M1A.F.Ca.IN.020.32.1.1]RUW08844.1 hypothetical protein EOA46_19630 [Mesorhizobium sp. M1A.F.Ca.IN.022.05.2.1]RUW30154.1 hypothetical protein EOA60_14090 [Mesorhizobium sp. M1A.F.Ca.IN.020.06.1.1]RWF81632.1 MAG: hypothetical protein EOQ35_13145 [Mesorhizobium sp.]RWG02983.1 MAG: hypothetical protein EOQ38_09160 [Mesorhizobium sp.]
MTAVIVRIMLRYAAAILVTRGLIGSDDASAFSTDPDVQMLIEAGLGVVIGGVAEAWHWAARKFGWEH